MKWFGGRKTSISNPEPFCGTGLMAPGIVCALRGPGQAQALFPQLAASPLLVEVFIFSPVRDYLNDKLGRLRTLTGNIQ